MNVITYHRTNLEALEHKFNKMKRQGLAKTPTAFVTFKSMQAVAIAICCPVRYGVNELKIQKAPAPADLYWDNLKYTTR